MSRTRRLLAAVAAASLITVPTGAGADSGCYDHNRAERAFVRLTNEARERAGLGRLRLDPELSRVARKHTREMVESAQLHHTPPHRLARRVTNWRALGENVGVGGTVRGLHQAFLDSPLHRANVLGGWRHVGVGAIRRDGRLWVTVIFETRRDPGTRLRMPPC